MKEATVFDAETAGMVAKAFELHAKGAKLLCPKCRSELIVISDIGLSNEYRRHPGIYCPTDEKHVCVLLNLRGTSHKFRSLFRNS